MAHYTSSAVRQASHRGASSGSLFQLLRVGRHESNSAELWLLPDWLPIHPWRWWIHTRMVYIPMGYLWGRKFKAEMDPLIASLREELYVQPYESINWPAQRGNIAAVDTFYPHTKTLKTLMASWAPTTTATSHLCGKQASRRRTSAGARRREHLVPMPRTRQQDAQLHCGGGTSRGHDSHAMRMHREKLKDFMWIGAEGMMMTGTNGSQLWDTSFIAQAMVDSGLAASAENRELTQRLLDWLDECQIRETRSTSRLATASPPRVPGRSRQRNRLCGLGLHRRGAQSGHHAARKTCRTSRSRSRANACTIRSTCCSHAERGRGFASYETINGPALLELINPAEVFGDIMIEYAYPECTTSVVTALLKFTKIDDYRQATSDGASTARLGISSTHSDWTGAGSARGHLLHVRDHVAVESLMLAGHTYENSEAIRSACDFLESKQMTTAAGARRTVVRDGPVHARGKSRRCAGRHGS